jgi:stress-induced morphogen
LKLLGLPVEVSVCSMQDTAETNPKDETLLLQDNSDEHTDKKSIRNSCLACIIRWFNFIGKRLVQQESVSSEIKVNH